MAKDRRFLEFQDSLNRSLNKTISDSRLVTFVMRGDQEAFIAPGTPGVAKPLASLLISNGYYLGVRMRVRLVDGGVTTLHTSITYRRSDTPDNEDWIFRYEYEPALAAAGNYQYPVAHMHVNAKPEHYDGDKPFPELHFPTRRLSLEEIIRHLIIEHDATTRGSREDALAFLEKQLVAFEQKRTDAERSIVVGFRDPSIVHYRPDPSKHGKLSGIRRPKRRH